MHWLTPRLLAEANVCRSFLWLPKAITLHGTLDGAGTTPQAVTISSSDTLAIAANIEVEITGTGIVGTATAQWRIFGGSWTAFTVQTSVALAGTSFTLGFPAGTYTDNDTYRTVIGSMLDDILYSWEGTSGSAGVLPYIGEINGRPTIKTDGVDRVLRTAVGTLPTELMGGIRTPFEIQGVFRYNGSLSPSQNQTIVSICNGASGQAILALSVASTGVWRVSKRGDTGGTTAVDGGAADNDAHYFSLRQSGTNVTFDLDGAVDINNVAQNVGATCSVQFVEIGGSATTGAPSEFYADCDWGGHAMYTGVRGTAQRAYANQFWKTSFGL